MILITIEGRGGKRREEEGIGGIFTYSLFLYLLLTRGVADWAALMKEYTGL